MTAKPLHDPLERAAAAQTIIRGIRLHMFLRADLDEQELSISLYHKVLEAATVALDSPPVLSSTSTKAISSKPRNRRTLGGEWLRPNRSTGCWQSSDFKIKLLP